MLTQLQCRIQVNLKPESNPCAVGETEPTLPIGVRSVGFRVDLFGTPHLNVLITHSTVNMPYLLGLKEVGHVLRVFIEPMPMASKYFWKSGVT